MPDWAWRSLRGILGTEHPHHKTPMMLFQAAGQLREGRVMSCLVMFVFSTISPTH